MMSRWSSPIPEITVWPVSSSNFTTKVGSSSESLDSPDPSLSWSPVVLGRALDVLVLLVEQVPLHRRHVERRGQVLHDGVEHRLHALVLERGSAQHGNAGSRQRRRPDRATELLNRGLLLVDELLHDGV